MPDCRLPRLGAHCKNQYFQAVAVDRTELETLWRSRLKDAQLSYEFARNYTNEVQRDLAMLSPAIGNYALQRAIYLENAALAEYKRVMRIYTDLVVEGKVPEERHKAAGGDG